MIRNIHSFQCYKCKRWERVPINDSIADVERTSDNIRIVLSSPRILTEADVIDQYQIDVNEWHCYRFRVKTTEGYRKDRKVEWEVDDGVVTHGRVKDSGKLLIAPMFHISAEFERKVAEIKDREAILRRIDEMKKFAPKYPKIRYAKIKDGLLFEYEMPDLQLGRLVAEDAAGKASSPDIYKKRAEDALVQMASMFDTRTVSQILFPLGHDYFDSNTAEMMTAHGTPQSDDVRWHDTFKLGCDLVISLIDALQTIAPVHVPIIVGNHDEERSFYLGEVLVAHYHHDKNVTIDNRPIKRKYYSFGRNLIGLTHGYHEKLESLAALMPQEMPEQWAQSDYREFHVGDKHHKKDMVIKTHEQSNGVVVRILRSLASPSVWEFDKGLVGSLQATEGFLWHPTNGLIAQYTSAVNGKINPKSVATDKI